MSGPRLASSREFAYARRRAREFGPFFDSFGGDDCVGFVPVLDLSPEEIRTRGQQVCVRLGAGEARVGIATWQFAVAARICSVAIGMLAAGAVMPDLSEVSVDQENRVGLPREHGSRVSNPEEAVDAFVREVADVLEPLHRRIHQATGVATGLLRGNTAAAIVSAARAALSQPVCAENVLTARVVDRIVATGPLRDTMSGTFPRVRRRTCCLFYRVPGGGRCGDCSLTRPGHR